MANVAELVNRWHSQLSAIKNIADVNRFVCEALKKVGDGRSDASIALQSVAQLRIRDIRKELVAVPAKENIPPSQGGRLSALPDGRKRPGSDGERAPGRDEYGKKRALSSVFGSERAGAAPAVERRRVPVEPAVPVGEPRPGPASGEPQRDAAIIISDDDEVAVAEDALYSVACIGQQSLLAGMRTALELLRNTFRAKYPDRPLPVNDEFDQDVVLTMLRGIQNKAEAKRGVLSAEIRAMHERAVVGEEQEKKRINDGSTAAGNRLSQLFSLAKHRIAKLDLDSPAILRFRLKRGVPTKVRVPTVRDVILLEAAAAIHENPVVRGYAAAEVLCCYGSMRGAQSREMDFVAVREMSGEKFLFSEAFTKDPQGFSKQRPFVQITPAEGILGPNAVLDSFKKMHDGVERLGCAFRGCDSKDGDPFKATRFTNVPCTADELRVAKRALYREICKYPPEIADAFGVNSARHFMVEVMVSRGTPAEHLVQAGMWNDHATKKIVPERRAVADRAKLLSNIPLMYAHNSRILYVCDVKILEMQALREYARKVQFKPPSTDAWYHFKRNVERHPLAPPLPLVPVVEEKQSVADDWLRKLLREALWAEGDDDADV
jgi:hypothetical protein